MKKGKKLFVVLVSIVMALGSYIPAYAESKPVSPDTGVMTFITLAENTDYRWNINGLGDKGNAVHLDTTTGDKCDFKIYKAEDDCYAIKYIKSGGTDRYVDIDGKSTEEKAVLHIWESDDDEVKGNPHRQFVFLDEGTDSSGRQLVSIKNKKSNLYVTYDDANNNGPSAGDELIQVKYENRSKWIITRDVVPLEGNEVSDLIGYRDTDSGDAVREDGVYVQFISARNRVMVLNKEPNGMVYNQEVGDNGKFLLKWNGTYSAYEVYGVDTDETFTDHMKMYEYSDNVFLDSRPDVSGETDTSALWRFIRQDNGTYLIQNARTGQYIIKGENEDEAVLGDRSSAESFLIDRFAGTDDPVNFNYAYPWMKDLPNKKAYLSSINLPGTHDTGTAGVNVYFPTAFAKCQTYYFGEQLNIGCRSFDIRADAPESASKMSDITVVHGGSMYSCSDRNGTELTLDDIFDDAVRFLKKYDSESLVMMVKLDGGEDIGLAKAMASFINENKQYIYMGEGVPSVEEAAGKMVLIRRYEVADSVLDTYSLEIDDFGIDIRDWDSYNYTASKEAIKIHDKDGIAVYAQDKYNCGSDTKLEYIEGTLKQTTAGKIPGSAWIFNYTSCASGEPLTLTEDINPWLMQRGPYGGGAQYFSNQRLGNVMLNYVTGPMAALVYETNTKDAKFYVTKPQAPETVKLTYGHPLSKAKFSGHLGEGTWRFDRSDYIPTLKDIRSGKKFTITFTPDDPAQPSVTREVSITKLLNIPEGAQEGAVSGDDNQTDSEGTLSEKADPAKTGDIITAELALYIALFAIAACGAVMMIRRREKRQSR